MADYPTLTVLPNYPFTEGTEDNVIKSSMEAGYLKTRVRYTRSRKTFAVEYKRMPNVDKVTLEAFLTTVRGSADIFAWTHPTSSVSYNVRFDKYPNFEAAGYDGTGETWDVSFTLVQV